MTNSYIYPNNTRTSSRKVLFSLMPFADQDNSIAKSDYNIDEEIKDRKYIESTDVTAQPKLSSLKKYEDELDKLKEMILKNTDDIKHIAILIEDKNELGDDEYRQLIQKYNNALREIDQFMFTLDELVLELDKRMEGVEQGIQWNLDNIKTIIKKEVQQLSIESTKQQASELHRMLSKWLLKQISIRTNGYDIHGILAEILYEQIILVVSDDIYVIPIKGIDFIKLDG